VDSTEVVQTDLESIKRLSNLTKGIAWLNMGIASGEGVYNSFKAFSVNDDSARRDYAIKAIGNTGEMMMSMGILLGPATPLGVIFSLVGVALWGGSAVWTNRHRIADIFHGFLKRMGIRVK
jgi:hypothetical protein